MLKQIVWLTYYKTFDDILIPHFASNVTLLLQVDISGLSPYNLIALYSLKWEIIQWYVEITDQYPY